MCAGLLSIGSIGAKKVIVFIWSQKGEREGEMVREGGWEGERKGGRKGEWKR